MITLLCAHKKLTVHVRGLKKAYKIINNNSLLKVIATCNILLKQKNANNSILHCVLETVPSNIFNKFNKYRPVIKNF